MVTVDQLEILLRSIPQYFLFGGLALYIISWIDKKPQRGIWGEALFVLIGIAAFVVMLSGMIPSPKTQGIDAEHIELVIKMLFLLTFLGLLSIASILIRLIRKKHWTPILILIFMLSIWLFFSSTRISKIKFELNPNTTELSE